MSSVLGCFSGSHLLRLLGGSRSIFSECSPPATTCEALRSIVSARKRKSACSVQFSDHEILTNDSLFSFLFPEDFIPTAVLWCSFDGKGTVLTNPQLCVIFFFEEMSDVTKSGKGHCAAGSARNLVAGTRSQRQRRPAAEPAEGMCVHFWLLWKTGEHHHTAMRSGARRFLLTVWKRWPWSPHRPL